MKKLFFLILLAHISFDVSSQILLLKGYYINLRGEKNSGKFQINFQEDFWLKDNITFYQQGEKSLININQIKELFLDDLGLYRRNEIKYPDDITSSDLVEVLVGSEASLYFYKNGNSNIFWIGSSDNPVSLLQERIAGSKSVKMKKRMVPPYRNFLNYYLKKCPEIQENIKKTQYNKASLVTLMEDYNNCINEDSIYLQKTNNRILWEIGPLISLGRSGFTYSNADEVLHNVDEIKFISSRNNELGLYGSFLPNKWNKKLELRTYLTVHSSSYRSVGISTSVGTFTYEYTEMTMNLTGLNLGILYSRYLYLNKHTNISVEAGPRFEVPLKKYNILTGIETTIGTSGTIISTRNFTKEVTYNSYFEFLFGIAVSRQIGNYGSVSLFGQASPDIINISGTSSLASHIAIGIRCDVF